jgi:dTDP-D-glucose 4,6-dehydratase
VVRGLLGEAPELKMILQVGGFEKKLDNVNLSLKASNGQEYSISFAKGHAGISRLMFIRTPSRREFRWIPGAEDPLTLLSDNEMHDLNYMLGYREEKKATITTYKEKKIEEAMEKMASWSNSKKPPETMTRPH